MTHDERIEELAYTLAREEHGFEAKYLSKQEFSVYIDEMRGLAKLVVAEIAKEAETAYRSGYERMYGQSRLNKCPNKRWAQIIESDTEKYLQSYGLKAQPHE